MGAIIFGFAIIFFSVIAYISAKKKAEVCTRPVEGIITRFEYEYDDWEDTKGHYVYVEYSYLGETYTTKLSAKLGMRVGNKLQLYINPYHPEEIFYEPNSNFIIVALLLIGIIFIIIGVFNN